MNRSNDAHIQRHSFVLAIGSTDFDDDARAVLTALGADFSNAERIADGWLVPFRREADSLDEALQHAIEEAEAAVEGLDVLGALTPDGAPLAVADTTGGAKMRRVLEPIRDSLQQLVVECQHLRTAGGERPSLPAADSPAMHEIASEQKYRSTWGEPARATHSTALILMAAADDEIECLLHLLTKDQLPVFGHVPLARAVLEVCSRVFWLMEPGIGNECRIARGQAERVHSLEQAERLPERAAASTLAADITAQLHEHGINEERRPSSTSAMTDLFGDIGADAMGPTIYNYFSAVAHGTLYGLIENVQVLPGSGLDGQQAAVTFSSSRNIAVILAATTFGYARAAGRLVDHFGWEKASWNDAVANAFGQVRRISQLPHTPGDEGAFIR